MENMYTLFGVAALLFAVCAGTALIIRAGKDNNKIDNMIKRYKAWIIKDPKGKYNTYAVFKKRNSAIIHLINSFEGSAEEFDLRKIWKRMYRYGYRIHSVYVTILDLN